MARVLRDGCKAVILAKQKNLMDRIIRDQNTLWKLESRTLINNGGLDCFIYVLCKLAAATTSLSSSSTSAT